MVWEDGADDVGHAVCSAGRVKVPAEQEAQAAVAIMIGAGMSMLDSSPAARRVLADHACLQLEMMALGGRQMAVGNRL